MIIVPENQRFEQMREIVDNNLDHEIFSAQQIEKSNLQVVSSDNAVAILPNRYDGIDFVDNECRLLIVGGLPRATNLQERFIIA